MFFLPRTKQVALLAFTAAAFLVACNNSSDDRASANADASADSGPQDSQLADEALLDSPTPPPDAGQEADGQADDEAAPVVGVLEFPGSYNAHFSNVHVALCADYTCSGCVPDSAASEGLDARIDIRQTDSGYEGVVTPKSGTPWTMQVAVTSASVVLSGKAQVALIACSNVNLWESWTQIEIPRGSNGRLVGAATAGGEGPIECGMNMGVGYHLKRTGPMSGDVTLTLDSSAPVASPSEVAVPHVPMILPWSEFRVGFSEPVERASAESRLLATMDAANVNLTWSLDPIDSSTPTWSGVALARGFLTDWSTASGATLVWGANAGFADSSGNVGAAATTSGSIVAVGPAVAVHDFSSGSPPGTAWGKTELLTGSMAQYCEAGSCLFIKEDLAAGCGKGAPYFNSGYLGRLSSSNATKVVVRYRVLLQGSTYPIGRIDVAAPGRGIIATMPLTAGPTQNLATTVAQECGDLTLKTGWADAEVVLPSGVPTTELGFSIELFNEQWVGIVYDQNCGRDDFSSATNASLLIQRIEIK